MNSNETASRRSIKLSVTPWLTTQVENNKTYIHVYVMRFLHVVINVTLSASEHTIFVVITGKKICRKEKTHYAIRNTNRNVKKCQELYCRVQHVKNIIALKDYSSHVVSVDHILLSDVYAESFYYVHDD